MNKLSNLLKLKLIFNCFFWHALRRKDDQNLISNAFIHAYAIANAT